MFFCRKHIDNFFFSRCRFAFRPIKRLKQTPSIRTWGLSGLFSQLKHRAKGRDEYSPELTLSPIPIQLLYWLILSSFRLCKHLFRPVTSPGTQLRLIFNIKLLFYLRVLDAEHVQINSLSFKAMRLLG